MNEKFPSAEKLKSKILIERLFSEGRSIYKFPVKLIYLPVKDIPLTTHKTGVSVPKRSFKKAVERNFLKRLMREAFRKNKYLVDNNLQEKYALLFIYTAKKKVKLHEVNAGITWILNKVIEKEGANEKDNS